MSTFLVTFQEACVLMEHLLPGGSGRDSSRGPCRLTCSPLWRPVPQDTDPHPDQSPRVESPPRHPGDVGATPPRRCWPLITARALQAANQLKSKSGGGDGRPAFRETPRALPEDAELAGAERAPRPFARSEADSRSAQRTRFPSAVTNARGRAPGRTGAWTSSGDLTSEEPSAPRPGRLALPPGPPPSARGFRETEGSLPVKLELSFGAPIPSTADSNGGEKGEGEKRESLQTD